MYMCMYICIYISLILYIYICVYMYLCIYVSIYLSICLSIYPSIYINRYIYIICLSTPFQSNPKSKPHQTGLGTSCLRTTAEIPGLALPTFQKDLSCKTKKNMMMFTARVFLDVCCFLLLGYVHIIATSSFQQRFGSQSRPRQRRWWPGKCRRRNRPGNLGGRDGHFFSRRDVTEVRQHGQAVLPKNI